MLYSTKLKPIVSSTKICKDHNSKQLINEFEPISNSHNFFTPGRQKFHRRTSIQKNTQQNSSKQNSPKQNSPKQSPRQHSPEQQSPRNRSPRRFHLINMKNSDSNHCKDVLKIDKETIKETHDDKHVFLDKTNNIDKNTKVISINDDLIKKLKDYADKINNCKIFYDTPLDNLNKIKQNSGNLKNELKSLKLNYRSLVLLTELMDELTDYLTLVNKEVDTVHNINDEVLIIDLLNAFKRIYALTNVFNKVKLNICINSAISRLFITEHNQILNLITAKITNVNDKIINFIKNASDKNISEIIDFLQRDDCEEINFSTAAHTLRTLNENFEINNNDD